MGRLVKSDFITHSGSHQSTAWIQNPSSSRVWQYKPSNTPICENHIKPVGFLETIYQNVQISREKGDLSHFKGCLLAGVIRSKLILVQLDHPVSLTARYHILAKYCILTKTYTAKYTLLNIANCQISHTAKYYTLPSFTHC